MEILVATQNAGKVAELEELLGALPFKLRSLKDFGHIREPEETGSSFTENAALKAKYYALQTKLPALADDSGLEVAALNGAPGIYSARYAGSNASDAEKTARLLTEINDAGAKNRAARFVCAIAFAGEMGEIIYTAQGMCKGAIAAAPRGSNGFGYDPVFIPAGFSRTFAELSNAEKQEISHRRRATNKIIAFLRDKYAV